MVHPKPNRYTKRRIAEIQLEQAVKLLLTGDPVCALTLAGAAEEILGKMVAAKGLSTTLEDWVAYERSMWDYAVPRAAAQGKAITIPNDKELHRRMNHARNEFKHNERGKNSSVAAYYNWEAEDMILRAIKNFYKLFDKPPRSKLVRDWWEDTTL